MTTLQPISQVEAIKHIEGFAEQQLSLLLPVQTAWQPTDFLPNLTGDLWREEVQKVREGAQGLSDELLIVLIGDMVTEEALPTYQTLLNRANGISDSTGTDDSPWARWTRGWTAEENRHGDLLNRYLYLTGRVDMKAVEVTIQYLLRNGFDPHTGNSAYRGFLYTSFQERATKVSHSNVAQAAARLGDPVLAKICSTIAGDEARHEEAYKRFIGKLLEIDPAGIITTFADMMRLTIAMPAEQMTDDQSTNLYNQFAAVAQRIGVYTARDYADIVEHLLTYWRIADFKNLPAAAISAQDHVCGLPAYYRRLADRLEVRLSRQGAKVPFRWIFNRAV